MEVSQRGEIQRTHNAGLVVTFVLELLALAVLGVLACFLRQVVVSRRDASINRIDIVSKSKF